MVLLQEADRVVEANNIGVHPLHQKQNEALKFISPEEKLITDLRLENEPLAQLWLVAVKSYFSLKQEEGNVISVQYREKSGGIKEAVFNREKIEKFLTSQWNNRNNKREQTERVKKIREQMTTDKLVGPTEKDQEEWDRQLKQIFECLGYLRTQNYEPKLPNELKTLVYDKKITRQREGIPVRDVRPRTGVNEFGLGIMAVSSLVGSQVDLSPILDRLGLRDFNGLQVLGISTTTEEIESKGKTAGHASPKKVPETEQPAVEPGVAPENPLTGVVSPKEEKDPPVLWESMPTDGGKADWDSIKHEFLQEPMKIVEDLHNGYCRVQDPDGKQWYLYVGSGVDINPNLPPQETPTPAMVADASGGQQEEERIEGVSENQDKTLDPKIEEWLNSRKVYVNTWGLGKEDPAKKAEMIEILKKAARVTSGVDGDPFRYVSKNTPDTGKLEIQLSIDPVLKDGNSSTPAGLRVADEGFQMIISVSHFFPNSGALVSAPLDVVINGNDEVKAHYFFTEEELREIRYITVIKELLQAEKGLNLLKENNVLSNDFMNLSEAEQKRINRKIEIFVEIYSLDQVDKILQNKRLSNAESRLLSIIRELRTKWIGLAESELGINTDVLISMGLLRGN